MHTYTICVHHWDEKFPNTDSYKSDEDYEDVVKEFIEEYEHRAAAYPDNWVVYIKRNDHEKIKKFSVSVEIYRKHLVSAEEKVK